MSDVTYGDDLTPRTQQATLAGAISRFETSIFTCGAAEFSALDSVIERIDRTGSDALLGRALSLQSRVQIIQGEHERAIHTAEQALAAFSRLEPQAAQSVCGSRSEALRAAGNALLKLGRVDRAFPKLEEAVAAAEAGLATARADMAGISAVGSLIRALITLGAALFATRELDTAIALYYRTLATAEAYPEAYGERPDDLMLAHWNLCDALHERATQRRSIDDAAGACEDLAAAERVLDTAALRIAAGGEPATGSGGLTPYGLEGYFGSLGRHLLLRDRPAEALEQFERQLIEIYRDEFVHHGNVATAQTGIAQAKLALNLPAEALHHSTLALKALDEHDEATDRAAALLVRACALRALGRDAEAYAALEDHHEVRSRVEAVAANQYASLMTARLGLERARADADSHRRIAAMLETLGRVGQEITANLDADAVCSIVQRHMRAMLDAPGFAIWRVGEESNLLVLSCGVEDDRAVTSPDIPIDDPVSFAARAVRERREIFHDFPPPEPQRVRTIHGTRRMQTALFAPLMVADRVLGVVSVQSDRAGDYSDNERSIFRTLCTYGAIALDNATAYTKLERTVRTLQRTQRELATRTAEYERLSMTDPLTGLANRRHLYDRAAVEIAERARKGGPLAVAMFDIDHFKKVNDTYGHAVGDVVLQVVARIAKEWLRPADFIARVGGEEFALLLPGAGMAEGIAIAERIRSSVSETPIVTAGATVAVTASFGVTELAPASETLDGALGRADAALYAAKVGGRNRVSAHGPAPR